MTEDIREKNEKYIYIIGLSVGFILFLSSYDVFGVTSPTNHASTTAFDTVTTLTVPITGTYTTDTNAILVVFWGDNNGGNTDYQITYAGANLTGGGSTSDPGTSGNHFWAYIKATSTSSFNGTKNIVISETITARNITTTATIFTGVDITGIPISASSTALATSATVQNNFTTVSNELVFDDVVMPRVASFPPTYGTGQTNVTTLNTLSYGSAVTGSKKTATSTGATSMSETLVGSGGWDSLAISIKYVAEVAALPPSIESDLILFTE